MPEGDTIFRVAARLRGALVGKQLVELEVRRDPRGRRGPEPGTEITAVDAAGKHLLLHFADGHVLHTHMQMTGTWHVYRPAERWRRPGHTARVVVRVDDGTTAVCFAAPIVELRRERDARDRPSRASRMLERLGPGLCEPDVDLDAVVTRLTLLEPDTELAAALLDQRVAAGISNVFKVGVCWAERIFPFTAIADVDRADPAGASTRPPATPAPRKQPDDSATNDVRQQARRVPEGPTLPAHCGATILSQRSRRSLQPTGAPTASPRGRSGRRRLGTDGEESTRSLARAQQSGDTFRGRDGVLVAPHDAVVNRHAEFDVSTEAWPLKDTFGLEVRRAAESMQTSSAGGILLELACPSRQGTTARSGLATISPSTPDTPHGGR